MDTYANLHMHTTHSDGVYTPEEITKVAKEEGYKAIAISDHDSATGYGELQKACKKEGLECLFAVEFSVRYMMDGELKACHIVAFDFDPEYPPMKEYLRKMGERETTLTKNCFDDSVADGGIVGITWEDVLNDNEGHIWLCNNHVFRSLLKRNLIKEENYMVWWRKNFAEKACKFKQIHSFNSLSDMVKLIKEAGGFAVVAHPHNQLDQIDYFMECGIEGMEVWHPDLNEEERVEAYKIALQKGLYVSGGCDHSGLCGGLYNSFESEEALKKSYHYIEPLSVGTTKEHFFEIKERKLNIEYREKAKKALGI